MEKIKQRKGISVRGDYKRGVRVEERKKGRGAGKMRVMMEIIQVINEMIGSWF